MKEKSFVKRIFEFDEKKSFTDRSKRYQIIIQFFSSADEKSYFKITKIQKVLLNEAPSLFDVDETKNLSENMKKEHNRFKKMLDDLELWGLITSNETKSIKGEVKTKEYRLTKSGQLFALIIKYFKSENKFAVSEKFYENWKANLEKFPTSLGRFLAIYLEKCKNIGLFDVFVDNFINPAIGVWNERVRNENDLLTQMTLIKTDDFNKNKALLDLWLKSLIELDCSVRILFLNHMRIHINRIIEKKVEEIEKYELKRYEKRGLDRHIIAEFQCSFCNFPKYYEFPVVFYLICIFSNQHEQIDSEISRLKCDNCEENNLVLNLII